MKSIATQHTHRTVALTPEQPGLLAEIASQLCAEFGHGVAWKTGASYVTLKDFTQIVVPTRRLKSVLRQYGQHVLSVR